MVQARSLLTLSFSFSRFSFAPSAYIRTYMVHFSLYDFFFFGLNRNTFVPFFIIMVCALWLAYFSQQIWTNELARTHALLNFVHIENPFGEVMSCYAVVVFVTVGWLPLFLLVKTQQSVSQPRNKRKYVHILCTNSHWQLITSNGI